MTEIIETTFKLRRGTKEAWERNNPVLADGEPGFATNANLLKIGDGVTPWKDLEPANAEFGSGGLSREIVDVLPEVGSADVDKIYMVKKEDETQSGNVYEEYMVINGAWEKIGDTQVDLSGYVTRDELVQPDWEQNDETADDYINNRPFYHIEEGVRHRGDFAVNIQTTTTEFFLKENCAYAVNIDGTEYGFRMPYDQGDDALCVRFEMDNGQILEILTYKGVKEARIYCFDENYHGVTVYERVNEQLLQLDEKFIPNTIARTSQIPVTTQQIQSDWEQSHDVKKDYIKNKPFYHVPAGELEIYDGSVYDTEYCEDFALKEGQEYILVVDQVRSVHTASQFGNVIEIDADLVSISSLFSPYDYTTFDTTTISSKDGDSHTVTLYEKTVEQLVQLDEKFIPDTIARVNDLPVGEGTTTSMVTVFDENVGIGEEYGLYEVDLSNLERGKVYTITTTIYRTDEHYEMEWNGSFSIYSKSADIDINIYPTYITSSQPMDARIKIETEEVSTVIKQLDEKYIPDTIARSAESHGLAMDDVSGEFVSAAEFNALLAILRDAGYLASSGALPPA